MFRTVTTLNSSIFKDTPRRQAVANGIRRHTREFKNLTKQRILKSKAAGRQYSRRGGAGFRRFHRASAYGQRPAIDTGRLLNSIQDKSTGEFSAEAFAGAEYAQFLNDPNGLNRPIMSERDAKEEEPKMLRRMEQVTASLT